jgi:ribonuclease P protein component
MRREQRLRRRNDFAAVYGDGRTAGNRLLVVRVRPNGAETARFGFVAGKTVGGAVVRNLVKRRLREAARAATVRPGLDIVIGARKSAAEATYNELERALWALLRKAGAWSEATVPQKEHS